MLLQPLELSQAKTPPADAGGSPTGIGVGLDTSRYGHYAAFLNTDLQAAAPELEVVESAVGYAKLRQRFTDLVNKHGNVHFIVRIDAAGLYADNLIAWLTDLKIEYASFAISTGDTLRNKNYRVAIYGNQKSDPIEARACARYALTERPKANPILTAELRQLRQIAGRLQAVVRQRTRLVNQLHQLLARTFPELAMLTKDITVGWVLELLARYPTAQLIARASDADLQAILYLPHDRVDDLLARARDSIASLHGELIDELVRDQVRQVRDISTRQIRLESLLKSAYRSLPNPNHLDTIKGIGEVTAAVLTAFILDIEHFDTPGKLVAYFGVMPMEVSSGVDRDGHARGPKRYVMCRRGNDLVRRYLWMAALTASRFNPACRPLYARVRAKHPDHPSIAIGHVMRKLLHLTFAIWKSGKPFDPKHYPWDTPAHVEGNNTCKDVDGSMEEQKQAAGLKPDLPAQSEVTATCASTVAEPTPAVEGSPWIDFAHVKKQLPIERVLDHLGLLSRLRGNGPQRRCTCPIHQGDGRSRTFSVNLEQNMFQCFDTRCEAKGDVIDLWALLHKKEVRAAALELVQTFHLEPAPRTPSPHRPRHG